MSPDQPQPVGDQPTHQAEPHDSLQAVLYHCGEAMPLHQVGTTWTGKPGEGTERDQYTYTCRRCTATVTMTCVWPC